MAAKAKTNDARSERIYVICGKDKFLVGGECVVPEHQAPDGHRLLSGSPTSPRPTGTGPEDAHQRADPEGAAKDGRGKEEDPGQEVEASW